MGIKSSCASTNSRSLCRPGAFGFQEIAEWKTYFSISFLLQVVMHLAASSVLATSVLVTSKRSKFSKFAAFLSDLSVLSTPAMPFSLELLWSRVCRTWEAFWRIFCTKRNNSLGLKSESETGEGPCAGLTDQSTRLGSTVRGFQTSRSWRADLGHHMTRHDHSLSFVDWVCGF